MPWVQLIIIIDWKPVLELNFTRNMLELYLVSDRSLVERDRPLEEDDDKLFWVE